MIKVGILGATGYAGIELVRILSQHPNVKINSLVSHTYAGEKITNIYPYLKNLIDLSCEALNVELLAKQCDLIFTALPHGVSKTVIPDLLKAGVKVIDLSGDFRYKDPLTYEKWYDAKHENPELLKEAVYGLPELYRNKISKARLIGNPGCYTTCSILALVPLLAKSMIHTDSIIIDAKSGVSGAGRNLAQGYHFCECTENMKAYKIASHRHTSEIEQELSIAANSNVTVSFTPHLVPIKRGIISTIYANLKERYSSSDLLNVYKKYYENEFFIRIYEEDRLPEIKYVAGSNFMDIGLVVDKRVNRVVIVASLDNLIKGAAGQAIQNMNILFNLDEKTGLKSPGLYI